MFKRLGTRTEDLRGREPAQTDLQQILAYLEELSRLRTLVHLHIRTGVALCLGGRIELVNEATQAFSVSFPHQVPRLGAGEVVDLHFHLAGMRFQAATTYLERGGYMQCVFRLPSRIQFAERRMAMRTRLGPREKASVAVFESLCEGLAASGRLVNLSMEGFCMRLDRAMQIESNKRHSLHSELFQAGQKLQVIRILNLPHLSTLECSGVVRFSQDSQTGHVLLGVQIEGIGSGDYDGLGRFMARRLPTFGKAFPVRRRRGEAEVPPPEEDGEDSAAEVNPEVDDEVEAEGAAAALGQEEALLEAVSQADDLREREKMAPGTGATDCQEDRLLRIRRRGKRILIIVPDDLDRSSLVCTLKLGGYAIFFEARNLVQGLEWSKKAQIDAVFVDQRVGPLAGTEVSQRVRKMGKLDRVPVFMFMRTPDVKALLSAKGSGVDHVVKFPVDFAGELKDRLDLAFGLRQP